MHGDVIIQVIDMHVLLLDLQGTQKNQDGTQFRQR